MWDYWDTLRLQYLRLLAEQSVGYYCEILDYNFSHADIVVRTAICRLS